MPDPRPLPDAPDLEQLRRQAKELLRAARAADPAALTRFRTLPALAHASPAALARTDLALHDAQSVIAREHGVPSWNALRERIEERTLTADASGRAFIEAATDGRTARAERLLARHPHLARTSLQAALVLGDAGAVASSLHAQPTLARQPGGPRDWEPLQYVCHTTLPHRSGRAADGILAIARQLLALGADPNTRFPWHHHGVRRPLLWGAAHVTRLLPLTALLLDAGADPNDGVTLPLAAGGGDVALLELLHASGASVDQPWASDGAATLYAILSWATTAIGVHWLLDHGAAPDPVLAGTGETNGETPLHAVARRWDEALAAALVARGADPAHPRADGRTPYALAMLHGNARVADWLQARGAADALPPVDQLVAAGARGDRAAVEAVLADTPALRGALPGALTDEHYGALHRAAERGDVAALTLLLDTGFDPNRGDETMHKTALHTAAMAGHRAAVEVLLARGASPALRDREFHGTPLVWAAEGARSQRDRAEDHAAVARVLLDAGSPTNWVPDVGDGREPGDELVEILAAWQRARTGAAA